VHFPQRAHKRRDPQMVHQALCPAPQSCQVVTDSGAVTGIEKNERLFAAQPSCSAPCQVTGKEGIAFQYDRRFVHELLVVVAVGRKVKQLGAALFCKLKELGAGSDRRRDFNLTCCKAVEILNLLGHKIQRNHRRNEAGGLDVQVGWHGCPCQPAAHAPCAGQMVVLDILAVHDVVGLNQLPGNPWLVTDYEQIIQLSGIPSRLDLPVELSQGSREKLLIELDAEISDFVFHANGLVSGQIGARPGRKGAKPLGQPIKKKVGPGEVVEDYRAHAAPIQGRKLLRM